LWNFIFAVNETDVQYKETTESRTYTAKLTNTDGTAYVGGVTISLASVGGPATITTVNGGLNSQSTWTGVTDAAGNLVFTVAVPANSASVTDVEATIKKTDSTETSKKTAKTHFFKLADVSTNYTLDVKKFHIASENDYVYANNLKFKWDANDSFFIRGQVVSQAAFETALSKGDTLTVDYKTKAENTSTWNITVDVTEAADLEFSNPADSPVTFDGFNYDLSGSAQAGNTVKVYRGDTLMGTTTADASGNWTLRAVNLTQGVANTFVAYQYAPGKDGFKTQNAEAGTATTVINEGAFASNGIVLTDNNNDGVSIGDTLTFSFLYPTYGNGFKDGLTGTITVNDGKGYTAKLHVEEAKDKADSGVLKIVNITESNTLFGHNSGSITVLSTTGLINQDQLVYDVAVSKANGGVTLGSGVVTTTNGTVSVVSSDKLTFQYGTGQTYTINASTILKNAAGTTLALGTDAKDYIALNDVVTVNGNVVTITLKAAQVTAAKAVNDAITAYAKTPATLVIADKGDVDALKASYDALNANQKTLVSAANVTKLTNLVNKIAQLAGPNQAIINAVANNDAAALGTALSTFAGYKAANNAAYLANATISGATLTTTQAAIEGAIATVNGLEATKLVKAAATTGTYAEFVAALKDAAFTGYNAANDAAYWAVKGSFNVATVALVDSAIAAVNANADIAAAAAALATPAIAADGLSLGSLPATGANGTAIAWTSGATGVITDAGVYAGTGTTTLTATISKASGTNKTVVFNVTADATKITAITVAP